MILTVRAQSRPARWSPCPGEPGESGGCREPDQGTALLLVVMAMLVAASLSLLILGAVIGSVRPTSSERKQVRAIHAAEAGINVALARIRAATMQDPFYTSETVGKRADLPCTTLASPLAGNVDGEPGNLRYSVQIRYYREDPSGQTETWRTTAANLVACGSTQPKFALISSSASGDAPLGAAAGSGDRRVELVYGFRTDNANSVGGAIVMAGLCFDAGTAPADGTAVTLMTCDSGAPQQMWVWRDDLTLVLAGTVATSPMCVTADPLKVPAEPTAKLYHCDGMAHQTWGRDDASPPHMYIRVDSTSYYLVKSGSTSGSALTTSPTASDTEIPDQAVGSGRAGFPALIQQSPPAAAVPLQWVNYKEYGRCIDINSWDVTRSVMLWPCKQDPVNVNLAWNQGIVWGIPTDGGQVGLWTYNGVSGNKFKDVPTSTPRVCLTSSAFAEVPLKFTTCNASQALQGWTVRRDTGDAKTSYTIVDKNGSCLAAGVPASDTGTMSTIQAQSCDGSESQMWNAPPTTSGSLQKDFKETTGQ